MPTNHGEITVAKRARGLSIVSVTVRARETSGLRMTGSTANRTVTDRAHPNIAG